MQLVDDTQAVKTMLTVRMNKIKGNWFLDLLDGIDYPGEVWGKKTIDVPLLSEFKLGALGTIGVTELKSFNADFSGRVLQVTFSAATIFSQDVNFDEGVAA